MSNKTPKLPATSSRSAASASAQKGEVRDGATPSWSPTPAPAGPARRAVRNLHTGPDPFRSAPVVDAAWAESDWKALLEALVSSGLVGYREVASLVLGHLNPSQVGTSIASKPTFQQHFPPRKTMEAVLKWHKEQSGRCVDCGTRLELQADHVVPREVEGDRADRLENMTLRCRRCNVIRRPSHKNGGKTFLTAEAALMWILLVKRPATYQEYEELCRDYGMTMANIRFKEAWAMAHWLARDGAYFISKDSSF